MEVNFVSFRRPFVLWTAPVPSIDSTVVSPTFSLKGCTWFIRFESVMDLTWGRRESWTLFLLRTQKEEPYPKPFMLAVHVKNREGEFQSMCCEIMGVARDSDNGMFVNSHRSFFEHSYPEVNFSAGELTFMFVFVDGIRNISDQREVLETEHKSIQTSPYLASFACLGNLSQDLCKLLDQGDSNFDAQVKCGDRTFSLHKLILGARSEVFKAMLGSDMLEGQRGFIEIDDMEPNDFELFLRYLYTGTLPMLTVDTASSLYEAGDKYRVEELMKRCGDYLEKNLTPNNACQIFAMADAHSDEDLRERLISYILEENIIDREDDWSNFSKDNQRLAHEVVYRAYKKLKQDGNENLIS